MTSEGKATNFTKKLHVQTQQKLLRRFDKYLLRIVTDMSTKGCPFYGKWS